MDIAFLFILLFALIVVAGPFIFILVLVKMIASSAKGNGNRMTAEETRAMQEIHRGLERMEKRVEALETIILDRSERVPEAFDSKEL
jgi:phage shock protein B